MAFGHVREALFLEDSHCPSTTMMRILNENGFLDIPKPIFLKDSNAPYVQNVRILMPNSLLDLPITRNTWFSASFPTWKCSKLAISGVSNCSNPQGKQLLGRPQHPPVLRVARDTVPGSRKYHWSRRSPKVSKTDKILDGLSRSGRRLRNLIFWIRGPASPAGRLAAWPRFARATFSGDHFSLTVGTTIGF